jgi:hypothetical protein
MEDTVVEYLVCQSSTTLYHCNALTIWTTVHIVVCLCGQMSKVTCHWHSGFDSQGRLINQAAHPSGVGKLVAVSKKKWVTTTEDCNR